MLSSEDSLERTISLAHSHSSGQETILVGCWVEDIIPSWPLAGAFLPLVACHVDLHTGQVPTWQLAAPRRNKREDIYKMEASGFVT